MSSIKQSTPPVRRSSSRKASCAAAGEDDVHQLHHTDQPRKAPPAGSKHSRQLAQQQLSSSDDDARGQHDELSSASASDDASSESEGDAPAAPAGHPSTSARARSHAAAGAGPSSTSAAAGKAITGSKKRGAAVAFQDAISLLPPDLDVETLVRVRQQLQPRNRMQKQALLSGYRREFEHWRFLLRQRFSLLFYGFGSKRSLLEAFAEEALTDGGVMTCDGLAPGVNSKQVLQAVASALTHRSCKSHSHSELLSLIASEPPCRQLYLLLHNIDGPGLRSAEEQLWLSRLSQAPAVRLIASVDHVNAPLLWNSRVAAAFNWLWLDGTTYAAYAAETRNVAPIITSCKQSATQRGATTVLRTLVSKARDVFKLLATQQLEDPSAAGTSFPLLLRMVRERFIFNHEQGLKSVLTEFRDHELIKLRPGPDGGEVMYIPMEPDVLRSALQEMQQADAA